MDRARDFVTRLPKVSLHCHLEGTMRAVTFREQAARYGLASPRTVVPLSDTYAFATFGEFLLTFAEVCKTLREPDDYARLAAEYAAAATEQGVHRAEIFISPSVWTFFHPALDIDAAVAAIHDELTRAAAVGGPEVRLICDLTRNFGAARAFETARSAVRLAEAGLGVIGVGLGGDEANHPAERYVDAFAFARAHGLHTVAHAGEAAGAASVRAAVEDLGAERIGHGVRALEDPRVVALLVERGIALECCPTSNRLTGAVSSDRPHPIDELDRCGVICTIDADDPELFSTTIVEEYRLVEALCGPERLVRFASNAIEASFAEPSRKVELREALARATGDLETMRP